MYSTNHSQILGLLVGFMMVYDGLLVGLPHYRSWYGIPDSIHVGYHLQKSAPQAPLGKVPQANSRRKPM